MQIVDLSNINGNTPADEAEQGNIYITVGFRLNQIFSKQSAVYVRSHKEKLFRTGLIGNTRQVTI